MVTVQTLAPFTMGALALLAVPGPSALYVVGRAVERGRVAGFVSVLGVETGSLIHLCAAVAGISGLVVSSPAAFAALHYGGAAYLLWLGMRAWRDDGGSALAGSAPSHARLFRDAVLVDLLNPKTALFFLAFLPGFVHQGDGSVSGQLAFLGLLFVGLAVLVDSAYASARRG